MQLCFKVENFCGGVRVTIERTVFVKLSVSGQTSGQTSSQTGDQTSGRTTQKSVQKSVQKIVDFISENPNITTQEMANLLGINRSIVARHIKTLQEKGIIHRFVVEHVVEGVVEAGVEIPSALSIAKQIDTSSRTVQRELAYLQAQGIIRRVGPDKGGHWEIIEKYNRLSPPTDERDTKTP